MPEVLPFRGVRYAASRATALSRLISPPYDVVSPAYRDELAARSPHNVIHVILDKDRPGDGPEENKYVRAARSFSGWLEDGTLRQDPTPSLYLLEQSFTGPDGRPRVRRGVVGAVRLQRYGEGLVLPHEKTLTAPKADRLEVLKRVQANLSPIFGLYEDDRGECQRALEAVIAGAGDPVAEADSDDGVHHQIWRTDDPALLAPLRRLLSERKVLIADGHHRYESALAYRDLVDRERPGLPPAAGHRFILMTLCSMSDPGLVIYPTHRLLLGLRDLRPGRFLDELGKYFTVDTLMEDLRRPAGRAWAVSKLAEHSGKATTFLMVSASDGKGRILTLRDDADLSGVPLPSNVTVRDLDVTALHTIVFQHLLGLSPRSQEMGENVRYEMDAGEVVTRTLSGEYQLGFLVNPTPMWQVQAVAESGETMPQKSTFFYPKLASGLVMRKIHEEMTGP
ncbi:MAG TPA: DUF1015 domain-containing protein [Anaeromyxobacteraceae bacterium]